MVPRMTMDHDVALSDFFTGLGAALDRARRTHQADLAAFFAGLGPEVAAARRAQAVLDRKQAVLDRRVAPRFSVFLGPRRADDDFKERETDLSRAFGGLLDPAGTHGQGDAFLLLFLDEIRRSPGEDLRGDFPCTDTRGCGVHLEYPTDEGRKIDIVLEMPDNRWIGIENKPWAKEQKDQIGHYYEYLRSRTEAAWVLYLSGNGNDPETLPKKGKERCLTMPYRIRDGKPPSVENWIQRCWERCEAERVRWFLKDLQKYVEKYFQPAGEPGARRGETGP